MPDPIIYEIANTGLTPGEYLLPSLNDSMELPVVFGLFCDGMGTRVIIPKTI